MSRSGGSLMPDQLPDVGEAAALQQSPGGPAVVPAREAVQLLGLGLGLGRGGGQEVDLAAAPAHVLAAPPRRAGVTALLGCHL